MAHTSIESGKTFISYAREDSRFALQLADDLRRAGANVWLDQLDIPVGTDWTQAVDAALDACCQLLVILSPASVSSENVMAELNCALEEGKKILPVLHKSCKRPFRIRSFQYADCSSDYQQGLSQLQTALLSDRLAAAPQNNSSKGQFVSDMPAEQPAYPENSEQKRGSNATHLSLSRPRSWWHRYLGKTGLVLAAALAFAVWRGVIPKFKTLPQPTARNSTVEDPEARFIQITEDKQPCADAQLGHGNAYLMNPTTREATVRIRTTTDSQPGVIYDGSTQHSGRSSDDVEKDFVVKPGERIRLEGCSTGILGPSGTENTSWEIVNVSFQK